MKYSFAAVLIAAIPAGVPAQIVIRLPTLERPTASASIGSLSIIASLGRGGIDVRLADPGTLTRGERRPTSTPRTSGPTTTPTSRASRTTARAVLATADQYVGTPYEWGGETPAGFDCSGFLQYVFRQHGVNLPRTSRQQVNAGEAVSVLAPTLEVGDLMFFATDGIRIDHVAMYAGGNRILHSSASGGGVGYDDLDSRRGRWFADHHVTTRRVLEDGRSLVSQLAPTLLRMLAELDPPDHAPRR